MRCKTILLLALSAWGIMACQNYTDKIAVEIRQPVYPVLTLKEHNPVLCLRLIRNSGVAYQLEKINFTLDGTVRSGDVVSASLFLDENCGQVCASAKPVNKQLSFKVGRQIEEDTLTCWVTLRLRDDAAQATSKIEISCSSVQTDLGLVGIRQLPAVKPLRIGVALRQPGQTGYTLPAFPDWRLRRKVPCWPCMMHAMKEMTICRATLILPSIAVKMEGGLGNPCRLFWI